jgi:hypothetical protein
MVQAAATSTVVGGGEMRDGGRDLGLAGRAPAV